MQGVRLIVNETPYTGPEQAGQRNSRYRTGPGGPPDRPVRAHSARARSRSCWRTGWRSAVSRIWNRGPKPRFRYGGRTGCMPQLLPLGRPDRDGAARRRNAVRIARRYRDGAVQREPRLQERSMPTTASKSQSMAIRAERARHRRGSALLMVLWLTAALSAIGLAVANNVRGGNRADGNQRGRCAVVFRRARRHRAGRAPHALGPAISRRTAAPFTTSTAVRPWI